MLVGRLGQFCGQEWKREVGCCDVLVVGDASRFWTCSRAEGCGGGGGADISIVFEQQPLLDGWQCIIFALAQTQFLHFPP